MVVIDTIVSLYLSIIRGLLERRISLSETNVFLLADKILVCECARDEIVLFNIDNRSVYLLNHTAAAVIRLTDGVRNLGWVARKVAWDFDTKTNVVVRDIKKIYRKLLKEGVIAMTPDSSFIPKIKQETVIREEDDGAFIFDPVTDELSAVNETGLLVLRQIDGKRTLVDIINTVASEFSEVEPDDIRRDVEAFVEGLVDRGVIGA
ncbi:MAG: PqqD family peptide modification chaperone [Deltaproteobacteria bacterium]|nr:PqqD family peptide modification chaperone [Candidatus Zymogenaceae bacterium]